MLRTNSSVTSLERVNRSRASDLRNPLQSQLLPRVFQRQSPQPKAALQTCSSILAGARLLLRKVHNVREHPDPEVTAGNMVVEHKRYIFSQVNRYEVS